MSERSHTVATEITVATGGHLAPPASGEARSTASPVSPPVPRVPRAKKPYIAPQLQVWGPVTELTQGFGGSRGDGQAGRTRKKD